MKILYFLALTICFIGAACSNTKSNDKDFPVDIAVAEYSLEDTAICQWVRIEEFNKPVIVNSSEELKNYAVCTSGAPKFDFLDYSLLLIKGGTPSSPCDVVETKFKQTSVNEYTLHIEVVMGMAAMPGWWQVHLKVPKLPINATITLNVNAHH